jgi:hypothetical protein
MRAFWLLVAALVGGVLIWQGRPWLEQQRTAQPVEVVPRAVTPAGDLAADEKATIELFERSERLGRVHPRPPARARRGRATCSAFRAARARASSGTATGTSSPTTT